MLATLFGVGNESIYTEESLVGVSRFERGAFILSAATLLLLYGYGVGTFGWFPGSFLDDAVRQAAVHFGSPSYVSERVFEDSGARIVDKDRMQPGYTLVSSHSAAWGWRTGLKLIDAYGRTLHEWPVTPNKVFDHIRSFRNDVDRGNIHGSHLFENGDVLMVISYVGILRMNSCGEIVWQLDNRAHHSVARADDGTFWIPTTTAARRPTSELYPDGYPGLDRPVNHDHLVRISESGQVLDSISVLDVLFENDLTRFLSKARPDEAPDLMHVNDVEPLSPLIAEEYPLFAAGDLVVSLRSPDLVLVVDPATRIVKWHASDPFVHQHDPDFIGNGWIGVFDNREDGTDRGTLLGGSRVLALQPHSDSVQILYNPTEMDEFYTPVLGKWQLLGNGNMLLTEGVTGRVLEVASDGSIVWDWVQEPFDEDHAVEVTEGARYPMTLAQISTWACESVTEVD